MFPLAAAGLKRGDHNSASVTSRGQFQTFGYANCSLWRRACLWFEREHSTTRWENTIEQELDRQILLHRLTNKVQSLLPRHVRVAGTSHGRL